MSTQLVIPVLRDPVAQIHARRVVQLATLAQRGKTVLAGIVILRILSAQMEQQV